MSLLIRNDQLINIVFHYLEVSNQHVSRFQFIQSKEEFEKHKNDPNFKELNTSWQIMTWAEHNKVYSQCIQYTTNEEGIQLSNLDFIKFRDLKLKTCLKNWDLKDDTGRLVNITSSVIDQLHPQVADELLAGFERMTEVSSPKTKES